jgi:cytoskeletal protein CcmA (bactofilin family)
MADAIEQIAESWRKFPMAWFDRGPGDKGDGKSEPEKSPPPAAVLPLPQKSGDPAAATTTAKASVTPAVAPADTGLVGHLYKGSRVTGQLTFQGEARIDGSVEGEIHCHGTLTIGEAAEVRAKISSQVVVIRGKVEGNVTAKEKVELFSPARVLGNISTPRLTVAEGVVFDGDCSMGMAKRRSGVASSQLLGADNTIAVSTPAQQSDSLK